MRTVCRPLHTLVAFFSVHLLEYDQRFARMDFACHRFTFYDFNKPLEGLSESWEKQFDFILVDPPFLSGECFEKVAETVKFLAKPKGKILLCTGELRPGHTNLTTPLCTRALLILLLFENENFQRDLARINKWRRSPRTGTATIIQIVKNNMQN